MEVRNEGIIQRQARREQTGQKRRPGTLAIFSFSWVVGFQVVIPKIQYLMIWYQLIISFFTTENSSFKLIIHHFSVSPCIRGEERPKNFLYIAIPV